MTNQDGWKKKSKGSAKIYTHPDACEGRAIVENIYGVFFNGAPFDSVDAAKSAAVCK